MNQPVMSKEHTRLATISGASAYMIWGVVGWYFSLLKPVPPFMILSHRVLWSLAFVAVLMTIRKGWADTFAIFKNKRTLAMLLTSSVLVAINWMTFIYAASTGNLIQASLGYFLAPMVNVFMGVILLREKNPTGAAVLCFAGRLWGWGIGVPSGTKYLDTLDDCHFMEFLCAIA